MSARPRIRWQAWAALALVILHFASYDVVAQPIVTDVRYFLYFAWRITEGAVPHRDFFDPKTQSASFLGALFFRGGELSGIDPLVAIRVGYLALAGLGVWLWYFVGSRLAGCADAGLLGSTLR